MDELDPRIEQLGFKPQHETVYNKLLPYSDQLDAESQRFLAEVKTNLSRAVQLRELRPGVFHWTIRLHTYIRLYGRKFSKEDHLHFINLYFELLTIPNLELRLIEKYARTLVILLKKKNLLTREDLVIPWRPLYELVERCFYSSYEPLGLEWFPQLLEQDLKNLVKVSRVYFSVESTQEMMDEFKPLLCPFDETMAKGIGYLELFLPTTLPPEQHDIGFKIWLHELLGIWDTTQNSPVWEVSMVELFARVANDNIGYIDWNPYVPKVFARFMRGFNLPVGSKKLQIGRMGRGYDTGITSSWIVAMLGHGSPVQEYLDKFFTAIESYFHPSNIGRYSPKLQRMLFKLPQAFIKRLHKERYKKANWQHPVPEDYKLTDPDITAFVESIKSCVFLSMFSKMGHMDAAAALQNLAAVRPELIIPQILEKTYVALDTLIEPHQLIATVSCVVAVARTMLKGGKWLPEGPTHLLPLLNAILPGIDPNDFTKCMVTFQAISTFTAMVPLVDCSEAPLHRDDITEQEREICSATARFEDFILQFMDRCFTLIEASIIEQTNSQDASHTKVNQQENMVDVGLSSTFGTMLSQCSPQLFETAINRLYNFISNRVFETKVSGKMVANMCRGASKVNPKVTLKKFVPLCSNKVLSLTEYEDVQLEEELDNVILFNLQILAELVRSASDAVLEYKDTIFKVLHSTLHLTCKTGYELSCLLLRYFLRSLTMMYPREYTSIPGGFDKPITEYLPIRDWAKPGDIHNLEMKWHEPTETGIAVAKEALDTFMQPLLQRLRDFIKGAELSREKLLQTLTIIYNCILGVGSVLPRWNQSPLTDIAESQVPQGDTRLHLGVMNETNEKMFANLREEIASVMHDLLHHMLATGEDDTKALIAIVSVNNSLLWYRGAIKQEYDSRWKSFTVVKQAMSNKLHGKKQHLRALLIDRVFLQHEQRILECRQTPYTALHRQILRDLYVMSTSRYSEVRKKGQTVLMWSMDHIAFSNRDIMPMMLANLKQNEQISHQQFKGALYLLQGYGFGSLACTHDWPLLKECWTALVQAGHSEKPSIMKLIDHISQKINKLFDTPSVEAKVTDGCVEKATVLYKSSNDQNQEAPTEEQITEALTKLQRQNEDNLRTYNSLVTTLVEMVNKGDLRWKFSQMAISFLTLLLRHDTPLPVPAVKMFINNLVHETLVIRKLAIAAVAAIMKQFKRPHTKVTIDPYTHSGCAPPTTGSCLPGIRPDNTWSNYDSQTAPKTKDEWEKCTFIDKTHWGYYTWPKSMEVYAPHEEQPKLDRSREELSEGEQVIYDFFTSDAQVSKLIGFLSLEDRKGKDKFNSKRFVLFKGLFRNFGDTFLPTFRPHLEKLASDSQESSQRCLAEIVAALTRGSKHWPFEKVASMWEMLQPIIRTVVNQISVETVTDWGTAIATCSESTDPRKLHWLFETLMESPIKEGGSFLDASALYLLQGGLMQQEWRVPELLHRLLNYLDPYLTHNYKNVRDRIGSLLTTVFLYDYMLPGGTETSSPHRKEFVDRIMPKLSVLQNPETWATSLTVTGNGSNGNGGDEADTVGSDPLAEERQTAIRLCKTVMKWLMGSLGRMVGAAPAEMFHFLPLVAPLESFESDEELRREAELTLACLAQTFLQPDVVPHVLAAVQQIVSGNSWRAKCSIMAYLQVMVYNNLFTLSSKEDSVETIHTIVMDLLKDDRLEVREIAGVTLSGLLHCGFFSMHSKFQGQFESLCKTKLPSKKLRVVSANNYTEAFSLAVVQRHAGILGLSACVQAYPYAVPEWMPQVLMDLTDHLHDPQPIEMTVRKTLSDFRRTHHDNWHQHKQQFTDDQLVVLTDLLVSPCYYA